MCLYRRYLKRTIVFLTAGFPFFFGHAFSVSIANTQADFFVATNGNDTWSGTMAQPNAGGTDGPFASLAQAREAVHGLKAAGHNKPVTVLIREGTYFLNEPLLFTPEDSGSEAMPIIYAAYPKEKPILSAGRKVVNWVPAGEGLWETYLPEVHDGKWYFHQLFVNNERRIRARTPNDGYLRTAGPLAENFKREDRSPENRIGFRFADGDIRAWGNPDDIQIILFHAWTTSHHWINTLDTVNRTVRFTAPSRWPPAFWEVRQRYILENFREALDEPGEWYLNRSTGRLMYFPLPGEDMSKAVCIAPRHKEVLRLEGDPDGGKWIEYLTFRGLSFQHSDWDLAKDNSADGQNHRDMKSQAVFARGLRYSAFEKCEITRVGAYALWLERGCQHNLIQHCHVHDLGAGGLRIGEEKKPETEEQRTGNNVIDNNWIHDSSHIFRAGIGIWVTHSSDNRITHNEISDLDYSGISIGWQWGFQPSTASDNIIEHNHIHHLGRGVLSDLSGIYTLGSSPGTRVANNVIHDIYAYSYGGWGLYNDEGSEYVIVESNLVYNTKCESYMSHWARNNIIRNNIFALSSDEGIRCAPKNEEFYFTLNRNIVYRSGKEMLFGDWAKDSAYRMNSNLFWSTSTDAPTFNGGSFSEWQARGHDRQSIIADPGFINPSEFDFRLRADSPALALGFEPIDTSKVGLYGDDSWMQAPKKIERASYKISIGEQCFPLSEGEGFESMSAGAPPVLNSLYAGKSGSIAVTDEFAASGRHSLRFADASYFSPEWSPHLYYKGAFLHGSVRLSFDLRMESGATFGLEMRDRNNFYRTGPSLSINSSGVLLSGQQQLRTLPTNQWIGFQIDYTLGTDRSGCFDLAITLPDGQTQTFQNIDTANQPQSILWIGFLSPGTNSACFYLDNVKVEGF